MKKRLIFILIIAMLVTPLASCGSLGGAATASLYIYNYDSSKTAVFQKLCDLYSEKSKRPVELINGKSIDGIKALQESETVPSVFMVSGISDYYKLINEGYLFNFEQAQDSGFISLASSVNPAFRLTTNNKNSYGLPLKLESYAFIVDRRMLRDLFELANTEALVSDLANASYYELQVLTVAIENYIRNPAPTELIIGGNDYRFAPLKTGLVEQLKGIYAIPTAEKGFSNSFMNTATNAVFESSYEAMFANLTKLESMRGPLYAYAEFLRFTSGFIAGDEGIVQKGEELSSANHNKANTFRRFSESKALFGVAKMSDYKELSILNKEQAKRLVFIPAKLPFYREDVALEGRTPDILNSNLAINTESYFAINGKSDSALTQLGMDFLVWLYRSPEGMEILKNDFDVIPFDTDIQKQELENSLANSMFWYKEREQIIRSSIFGAPKGIVDGEISARVAQNIQNPRWQTVQSTELSNFITDLWMSKR